MKLLRNISLPLIASLALFACERDYDAPLLTEPEYTVRQPISRFQNCVHKMQQQQLMCPLLSHKAKY